MKCIICCIMEKHRKQKEQDEIKEALCNDIATHHPEMVRMINEIAIIEKINDEGT